MIFQVLLVVTVTVILFSFCFLNADCYQSSCLFIYFPKQFFSFKFSDSTTRRIYMIKKVFNNSILGLYFHLSATNCTITGVVPWNLIVITIGNWIRNSSEKRLTIIVIFAKHLFLLSILVVEVLEEKSGFTDQNYIREIRQMIYYWKKKTHCEETTP